MLTSSVMTLTKTERCLLGALVRGEPLLPAATTLGLTPAQAQETLQHLQARSGAATPRALRTYALIYRWIL